MNEKEYNKRMHESLNSYDLNLKHMSNWYSQIVDSLKGIHVQAKVIKHPRHLGDYLEDEIRKLVSKLLPTSYSLEKGFGINYFSAISPEQDILIIDGKLGSAFYRSESVGYFPIESILGSIEVKSNLTLSELRKSILNCVNLKKLNYSSFDYPDNKEKRIFYTIFAYTSPGSEDSFTKTINELIAPIPESLRPNMIYILDKGLYFPTQDGGVISTRLEGLQTVKEEFMPIKNSVGNRTEAENFILCFSCIINSCFHQSGIRSSADYCQYITTPSGWGKKIEHKGPIKKYINGYTMWPRGDYGNFSYTSAVQHSEQCDNCGYVYQLFKLPPLSSSMKESIKSQLLEKGAIEFPKSMEINCNCGNKIDLKDKYQ